MRQVEIRIIVDRLDPPCGRLSVVADPSQRQHQPDPAVFRFTSWLGLLKALYEVTGGGGGELRPAAPPRHSEQ
jgi:hypothetical protein